MKRMELAEGVGFEPTRAFALPVFKTGAINRSTTPPERLRRYFATTTIRGKVDRAHCAVIPSRADGEGAHSRTLCVR